MPMCFVNGCEEESLGKGFYGRLYCNEHYQAAELVVIVAHKNRKDAKKLLIFCFERHIGINDDCIPQDSIVEPQNLIIPGINYKGALFCPSCDSFIPYAKILKETATCNDPGITILSCPIHPNTLIKAF